MSEQIKFYKGLEINLPRILQMGCIYHCTDTGNTYLGMGDDSRILFSNVTTIDVSLTQSGAAADANAVQKKIDQINARIDNLGNFETGLKATTDGQGNIILESLYLPIISTNDGQGNVTITI